MPATLDVDFRTLTRHLQSSVTEDGLLQVECMVCLDVFEAMAGAPGTTDAYTAWATSGHLDGSCCTCGGSRYLVPVHEPHGPCWCVPIIGGE